MMDMFSVFSIKINFYIFERLKDKMWCNQEKHLNLLVESLFKLFIEKSYIVWLKMNVVNVE